LKQEKNRLGGKIALYVMGEEATLEIDSIVDFQIVEALLNSKA
jgi:N-acylneuraminate cytidylyltransferase